MNRYLDLAATASMKSSMPKRVGAIAVRGGRVIGIGFNREGSCNRTPAAYSRHAEVVAILDAMGAVKGATVYVYRAHRRTNAPRMSRPCPSCYQFMRNLGVKKIVYSINGGYATERII